MVFSAQLVVDFDGLLRRTTSAFALVGHLSSQQFACCVGHFTRNNAVSL